MTDDDPNHPIEGQIVLMAGAKASVPLERLSELLGETQADLGGRIAEYRQRYECVHETPEERVFLVEEGHWETVGNRLGFGRREWDGLRRAHEQQLYRIGRRERRRSEFDSALEIRDAVVIGTEE
ncbi:hypothetical protein ACFFQF_11840 [Haladaptatus pallidirubidus]|uniref:DUF8048 domain-containing protein n=1 Tax=Haladaptatus pallidirubidus TaxID=1008152 RepID=A0AAV3UFV9_9EURY|nr:hypothetical protein [Haladaptatus pallidirubidus]